MTKLYGICVRWDLKDYCSPRHRILKKMYLVAPSNEALNEAIEEWRQEQEIEAEETITPKDVESEILAFEIHETQEEIAKNPQCQYLRLQAKLYKGMVENQKKSIKELKRRLKTKGDE